MDAADEPQPEPAAAADAAAPTAAPEVVEFTFHAGPLGLGIVDGGGIIKVTEGSQAFHLGVRAGDRLVRVDTMAIREGQPYVSIIELIKCLPRPLAFAFERGAAPEEPPEEAAAPPAPAGQREGLSPVEEAALKAASLLKSVFRAGMTVAREAAQALDRAVEDNARSIEAAIPRALEATSKATSAAKHMAAKVVAAELSAAGVGVPHAIRRAAAPRGQFADGGFERAVGQSDEAGGEEGGHDDATAAAADEAAAAEAVAADARQYAEAATAQADAVEDMLAQMGVEDAGGSAKKARKEKKEKKEKKDKKERRADEDGDSSRDASAAAVSPVDGVQAPDVGAAAAAVPAVVPVAEIDVAAAPIVDATATPAAAADEGDAAAKKEKKAKKPSKKDRDEPEQQQQAAAAAAPAADAAAAAPAADAGAAPEAGDAPVSAPPAAVAAAAPAAPSAAAGPAFGEGAASGAPHWHPLVADKTLRLSYTVSVAPTTPSPFFGVGAAASASAPPPPPSPCGTATVTVRVQPLSTRKGAEFVDVAFGEGLATTVRVAAALGAKSKDKGVDVSASASFALPLTGDPHAPLELPVRVAFAVTRVKEGKTEAPAQLDATLRLPAASLLVPVALDGDGYRAVMAAHGGSFTGADGALPVPAGSEPEALIAAAMGALRSHAIVRTPTNAILYARTLAGAHTTTLLRAVAGEDDGRAALAVSIKAAAPGLAAQLLAELTEALAGAARAAEEAKKDEDA